MVFKGGLKMEVSIPDFIQAPWFLKKPSRVRIAVLLSIFFVEVIIMFILRIKSLQVILLDALLLTAVLFTFLYVLIYIPLNRYIDKMGRAEIELKEVVSELQKIVEKTKEMSGLLPTCAYCRKVMDRDGKWVAIEKFISEHSDASFTHSMCDECFSKIYDEESKKGD